MSHPFWLYLLASALCLFTCRKTRAVIQIITPILALISIQSLIGQAGGEVYSSTFTLGGHDWWLIRADKLSLLFVYIFIFFSFCANIYSLHMKDRYVSVAANLYVGSSIGAALAGDLAVLFVFWEIMAITSAVLIWNKRKPNSLKALFRYLLVHGAGGLLFFTGVMIRIYQDQNLTFGAQTMDTAGWLIFLSFAVNAAIPPLHAWLPDAYPSGTPGGSVYMSAFTTKVAIYAFARAFAGEEILIWLGVIAAVYGVIFALMEDDMRKLLSYHIICQVGYMIVGIGLGTHLGINAGTGHAVGNILFKGLLFMATGAIIHCTRRSKLSELGGLASRLPLVFALYMMGAFAISGLPGLNGYVTKTLLLSAANKAHWNWLDPALLLVAVGTFLSIALKLAYFAFFARPCPKKRLAPLPWNSYLGMGVTALACVWLGVSPESLYRFLPYEVHAHVFTPDHIIVTVQMLLAAFAGFLFILPSLSAKPHLSLDADWFYRKGAPIFIKGFCFPLRYGQERIQQAWTDFISNLNKSFFSLIPKQTVKAVGYPLLWMTSGFVIIGFIILISW